MESHERATRVPKVDAHCHLDLYPNYKTVIEDAEACAVATIAVTNTPSVFDACERLLAGKRYLRTALGLHPELVVERHGELPLFRELLPATRFVGEVGLDYVTRDEPTRALQRHMFEAILSACSPYGDRILTIHSRRAANDVVEIIGDNYAGRIILHWFTGPLAVVEKGLAYGFYFSVNPAMTRSASGREIIALLPPDRVLTETDGPFGTDRDRAPLLPGSVDEAIAYLAVQWSWTELQVFQQVFGNFRSITRKPSG